MSGGGSGWLVGLGFRMRDEKKNFFFFFAGWLAAVNKFGQQRQKGAPRQKGKKEKRSSAGFRFFVFSFFGFRFLSGGLTIQ